jgi:hypothetical protein
MTVAVYWRVSQFGFINYDDGFFVFQNPHVYSGLTLANVKWAFTSLNGGTSTYHPLTWLTHQLDCQLFGVQAGAHHLTNLILHTVNTVLLFNLLIKLTDNIWRSAGVAALFALHPLHIETVAWISERKSIVCFLFWLLTMHAYIRYVQRPGQARYFAVLALFAGALLSKPIAVGLPITLILLDYWPLGRLRAHAFRVIVAEKMPLFLMSGIDCYVTVLAQSDLGATSTLQEVPMGSRLNNSVIACIVYLRKMLDPVDLAPIYPLRQDWSRFQVVCCLLILLSISALAIVQMRRRPHLFVGWTWYIITLLPTLGLVQAGKQGMADRYTYVALIGIFLAVAWECASLANKIRNSRMAGVSLAFAAVACCAIATWVILPNWRNSVSLFEHAALVVPHNYIAHRQLGLAFLTDGNLNAAERQFRESLGIVPRQPYTEIWLGDCFFRKGDCGDALEHYLKARKLRPDSAVVHHKLAQLSLLAQDVHFRDRKQALEEERRACELTHYEDREPLESLARIAAENRLFGEALFVARIALQKCVIATETQRVTELIANIVRMKEMQPEAIGLEAWKRANDCLGD